MAVMAGVTTPPAAAAQPAADAGAGRIADDSAGDQADRAEHQSAGAGAKHAVERALIRESFCAGANQSQRQNGGERCSDHESTPLL